MSDELTLNVKIKHRYDTSDNWGINNPILLNGEIGIESDTKFIKIGDGITAWNSLEYIHEAISIDDIQKIFES